MEHVTHPSLIPDFADEILITFVKHAPQNDYSIPLSYFHTVQPILKTQEATELLFDAMARTSVTESLWFTRTRPEAVQEQLFKRMVSTVLDAPACDETAHRSLELVSLPLESNEEAWLEEHLSSGDGKKLKHAKDTLLARKIATGRYTEAIQEKGVGPRWGVVMEGVKIGLGGRTS